MTRLPVRLGACDAGAGEDTGLGLTAGAPPDNSTHSTQWHQIAVCVGDDAQTMVSVELH